MSHEVTLWTLPPSYYGLRWDGWYTSGFGQHRDSDALDRVNFAKVLEDCTKAQDPAELGCLACAGTGRCACCCGACLGGRQCAHGEELACLACAGTGVVQAVTKVSEDHWAVGWVEWIAIHPQATAALECARALCAGANDYPSLDDDKLSEVESLEADESWANTSLRERIALCARGHVSIFAARRAYPPSDDNGSIQDALPGH